MIVNGLVSMKNVFTYLVLVLLIQFSACKLVTPKEITDQPPSNPSALTNQVSEPNLPVAAHAFRVVRVNNNLQFVILQNVSGIIPPIGQILDVYRDEEFVGKITAGGRSDETFLSADILEGTIQEQDIAFYIINAKP